MFHTKIVLIVRFYVRKVFFSFFLQTTLDMSEMGCNVSLFFTMHLHKLFMRRIEEFSTFLWSCRLQQTETMQIIPKHVSLHLYLLPSNFFVHSLDTQMTRFDICVFLWFFSFGNKFASQLFEQNHRIDIRQGGFQRHRIRFWFWPDQKFKIQLPVRGGALKVYKLKQSIISLVSNFADLVSNVNVTLKQKFQIQGREGHRNEHDSRGFHILHQALYISSSSPACVPLPPSENEVHIELESATLKNSKMTSILCLMMYIYLTLIHSLLILKCHNFQVRGN